MQNEIQNNEFFFKTINEERQKIKSRIEKLIGGSRFPFTVTKDRQKTILKFCVRKGKEEDIKYCVAMTKSLLVMTHFKVCYIYYNKKNLLQVDFKPDWEAYKKFMENKNERQ